jgi:hypothetical protein
MENGHGKANRAAWEVSRDCAGSISVGFGMKHGVSNSMADLWTRAGCGVSGLGTARCRAKFSDLGVVAGVRWRMAGSS